MQTCGSEPARAGARFCDACGSPIPNVYIGRGKARSGDHDGAISLMRKSACGPADRGQLGWLPLARTVLAETLLECATADDFREVEGLLEEIRAAHSEDFLVEDIFLLRLQAVIAPARGDDDAYVRVVRDYRDLAESLGFQGHIAWAKEMSQAR
jgi:adenylate cyclase